MDEGTKKRKALHPTLSLFSPTLQIYERIHPPSPDVLVPLEIVPPLRLNQGETIGFYVHSALPGDRAIVYDNQKSLVTYQDRFIKVRPSVLLSGIHPLFLSSGGSRNSA